MAASSSLHHDMQSAALVGRIVKVTFPQFLSMFSLFMSPFMLFLSMSPIVSGLNVAPQEPHQSKSCEQAGGCYFVSEVGGGGNCLFMSIADQLNARGLVETPVTHKEVRAKLADTISRWDPEHPSFFHFPFTIMVMDDVLDDSGLRNAVKGRKNWVGLYLISRFDIGKCGSY